MAFLLAAAVLISYALLGEILVRRIVQALRKQKPLPLGRWKKLSHAAIFGVVGLSLLCVAYAFWVEPYWPEVTQTRVFSDKLPAGCRPIRIVQISDLHCDTKVRLEERLPGIIRDLAPDVIVYTGDSVNSPQALPVFKACMTSLGQIAPTFAVRGNWDIWYPTNVLDLYGGTGVKELNGDVVRVQVGQAEFYLAGLPVDGQSRLGVVLKKIPPKALTVFAFHYPEFAMELSKHDVDLVLSGHTHGGQVALPWYGAIIIPAPYGKLLERGLYHVGPTQLYVNRGVGMEGGHSPRVRFLSRPEVTLIELCPNPWQPVEEISVLVAWASRP